LRALAGASLLAALLVLQAIPASAAPSFTIRGRGWGHGVGMSQWGAEGLARQGFNAGQILGRFYTGTTVQSLAIPNHIRVGLIQEQDHIDFTGNGQFDIYDHFGHLRASGQNGEVWRSRPLSAGTNQLGIYNPGGGLSFTSAAPVTLRFESRGTLLRLPQTGFQYKHDDIALDVNVSSARERAILTLSFQRYLYGLGEVPASWPNETLKAQVIAARTYALEKVTRLGQYRAVCNCGVYASTSDQAYVGVSQEVSRWVSAVDATNTQVVTYNGKAIQAYYSSSDGGFTENVENVFGGDALPYLRGVCDPGDYDSARNPNGNWSVTLDGDQIGQRLEAGGYSVGSVQELAVIPPRGVSGRMLRVIDATHGGITVRGSSNTARISGNTFQSLVGLKSTFISHSITGRIRNKWDLLNCAPGLPSQEPFTWTDLTGAARGSAQDFSNGRIFFNSSANTVFWIWGPILSRYSTARSQGTDLGLPVSDVFGVSGGRRANFERGFITWNASSGQTAVTVYH
jgi:SpoIID/LytB domain protein